MKKLTMIFALSVAFFVGTKIYAQEGLSFGVKAGANLSKFMGSNVYSDLDMKFGFQVGATVEYGFAESWFLGSGLEFTTKGARNKVELAGVTTKSTITPMYIQLPVHIGYKFEVGDDIRLLVELGPYAAFGVAGKSKVNVDGGLLDGETKIDFFGDDNSDALAKRFDFGVGAALGVEFGRIGVKAGYDLGLIDISHSSAEIKNSNIYLTVGYRF